jgi:hypothetical protein
VVSNSEEGQGPHRAVEPIIIIMMMIMMMTKACLVKQKIESQNRSL